MKKLAEKVLREGIDRYGEKAPSGIAMEECGELIQAINKVSRKGKEDSEALDNLTEEIGDVMIMIKQLQIMYDITDADINKTINKKIKRQVKRFKKEDEKKEKVA